MRTIFFLIALSCLTIQAAGFQSYPPFGVAIAPQSVIPGDTVSITVTSTQPYKSLYVMCNNHIVELWKKQSDWQRKWILPASIKTSGEIPLRLLAVDHGGRMEEVSIGNIVIEQPMQATPEPSYEIYTEKPPYRVANNDVQTFLSNHPDKPVTRADICYILVTLMGLSLENPNSDIAKDVSANHPFSRHIATALMHDLLRTYDNQEFRPADPISRAYAAVLATKSHNLAVTRQTHAPFADVPQNHWAAGHIAAVKNKGIVPSSTHYYPKEVLRRKDVELFFKN